MAVFQVLPEMIGAEEFLGLVALAELMDVCEVLDPFFPVGLGNIGEIFAAVAADVDGG